MDAKTLSRINNSKNKRREIIVSQLQKSLQQLHGSKSLENLELNPKKIIKNFYNQNDSQTIFIKHNSGSSSNQKKSSDYDQDQEIIQSMNKKQKIFKEFNDIELSSKKRYKITEHKNLFQNSKSLKTKFKRSVKKKEGMSSDNKKLVQKRKSTNYFKKYQMPPKQEKSLKASVSQQLDVKTQNSQHKVKWSKSRKNSQIFNYLAIIAPKKLNYTIDILIKGPKRSRLLKNNQGQQKKMEHFDKSKLKQASSLDQSVYIQLHNLNEKINDKCFDISKQTKNTLEKLPFRFYF